jgi:phospholipase B1
MGGGSKWVEDISDCPIQTKQQKSSKSNVWKVKASDIDTIAALGDSVTAGLFAEPSTGTVLKEYRGLSFSVGGDANRITLPNFVKHFNKHLQGASIENHRGEWCFGKLCPPWQYLPRLDKFNAAQSGARISNLQHEMNYLVPQIQQAKSFKVDNIKLITIFIGSNDLCLACSEDYEGHQVEDLLIQLLKDIRLELPYSIVNLVSLMKVSQIYDITINDPYCKQLHGKSPMFFECRCAFDTTSSGDEKRKSMDKMATQLNKLFHKIAKRFNRKRDEKFAVVVDPIFEEMDIRKWNATELLSSMDCFHPSALAHSHMATAIWNNLWHPPASKLKRIDFPFGVDKRLPVYCPSADEILPF